VQVLTISNNRRDVTHRDEQDFVLHPDRNAIQLGRPTARLNDPAEPPAMVPNCSFTIQRRPLIRFGSPPSSLFGISFAFQGLRQILASRGVVCGVLRRAARRFAVSSEDMP
jgi:hypothetical protein